MRRHIVPLFFILTFIFLLLGYQVVFEGRSLGPFKENPWIDPGAAYWANIATSKIVHQIVADGELPLWSSGQGIGAPLLADPHIALLYPLNLLVYLHPEAGGWDAFYLLRLSLLVLATYAMFSGVGVRRWVAAPAALMYGFSGSILLFVHHFHPNTLAVAPLFLLGVHWALTGKPRAALFVIAVSGPLMMFGGGLLDLVLSCLYAAFIVAAWLAFNLTGGVSGGLVVVSRLFAMASVALLISAPFLLPYLELRSVAIPPYSGRSTATIDDSWYFLGLLVDGIAVPPRGMKPWEASVVSQYLHLIALPGALLSLLALVDRRVANKHLIAGSLVFFLFYYFKLYGYPFLQFVNDLPLLKDVRFVKYQGTFALSYYFLAAAGYDYAARQQDARTLAGLILTTLVSTLVPATYALHHGITVSLRLAAYVCLPLLPLVVYALLRVLRNVRARAASAVTLLLLGAVVYAQIYIDMPHGLAARQPYFAGGPVFAEAKQLQGQARVFPMTGDLPRVWTAQGVNDVRDFSVVHTKRYLKFFKQYVERRTCWHFLILCSGAADKVSLPLLRLLGVRYVVIQRDQESSLAANPDRRHRIVKEVGEWRFVDLLEARPLITLADRVVVDTAERILHSITGATEHDPAIVYLEQAPVTEPAAKGDLEYEVADMVWAHNAVTARVTSNKPAWLVLNSQYFPGWTAYLDGAPLAVARANYLFQAIPIPGGTHTVEFRYEPVSLRLGGLAMLAGLFVCVLLARRYRAAAPG